MLLLIGCFIPPVNSQILRSRRTVVQQPCATCNNSAGMVYYSTSQPVYSTAAPIEPTVTPTATPVSTTLPPIPVQESDSKFRKSLVSAIAAARKAGKINARQAIRLRVATISPAFLEQAEELCVIQMAMSEDGGVLPRTETGAVDKTAIDWEGFASFLERIIPLLLELFTRFGL